MLLIRSPRHAGRLTSFACGLVLITSCAPAVEPSGEYLEPEIRDEVLARVRDLNYPFAADPAFSVRIGNLQTRLINECVERQGVVAPDVEPLEVTTDVVVPDDTRLWLLPDQDYGVAAALASPDVVAELRAAQDPLDESSSEAAAPDPEAYDRAVYGPDDERVTFHLDGGAIVSAPVGGCFGEATEAMYGVPAADYERAYQEIPQLRVVMDELRADGPVRASLGAWSRCMDDAGFPADDPSSLYAHMSGWVDGVVAGRLAVSSVAEEERRLAEEDQTCRTSSGLGTTLSEKFIELADAEIAGREGVVQEYRAMIEHAQSLIG